MKNPNGAFSLYDAGSQNGTWLAKQRLVPRKAGALEDSQQLRLGNDVYLRFFTNAGLFDYLSLVRRMVPRDVGLG
jgi:hypothetical protein